MSCSKTEMLFTCLEPIHTQTYYSFCLVEVGNINKPSNGVHEENGILFWINRSGFPMDTCSWNRMWNHVTHTHPEGNVLTDKIRNNVNLPQVYLQ